MRVFAGALLLTFATPAAWGWGSYGHQQINRVAVKLLQQDANGAGLGKCFATNLNFIQRLAITPDYDWKNLGTHPPGDLFKIRMSADKYEHPHHYFEADAFIKGDATAAEIQKLPADDFQHAFSTQNSDGYPALFKANIDKIQAVNPTKLTETQFPKRIDKDNPQPSQVAGADGSAPWRIKQLFELASDSLKSKRFDMAFMYMGAMGHYVGDMSQPFHASLNFDGDYYTDADGKWVFHGTNGKFSDAAGIHHSFEEAILENAYAASLSTMELLKIRGIAKTYCAKAAAGDAKKESSCSSSHARKADPNNDLWFDFSATEAAVLKRADAKALKNEISDEQVVQEVLNLIAGGYKYATPLLNAFAQVTKQHPPTSKPRPDDQSKPGSTSGESGSVRSISVRAINAFVNAKVVDGMTTMDIAEQRMADSATLLARLWLAVLASAGTTPEQMKDCAQLEENKIDEASNYSAYQTAFLPLVIKNYPFPTYIFPELAARMPQSQKAKKKKSTAKPKH